MNTSRNCSNIINMSNGRTNDDRYNDTAPNISQQTQHLQNNNDHEKTPHQVLIMHKNHMTKTITATP